MPKDKLLLSSFCFYINNDKGRKILLTVWHSAMWTIWKARNDFKFS